MLGLMVMEDPDLVQTPTPFLMLNVQELCPTVGHQVNLILIAPTLVSAVLMDVPTLVWMDQRVYKNQRFKVSSSKFSLFLNYIRAKLILFFFDVNLRMHSILSVYRCKWIVTMVENLLYDG